MKVFSCVAFSFLYGVSYFIFELFWALCSICLVHHVVRLFLYHCNLSIMFNRVHLLRDHQSTSSSVCSVRYIKHFKYIKSVLRFLQCTYDSSAFIKLIKVQLAIVRGCFVKYVCICQLVVLHDLEFGVQEKRMFRFDDPTVPLFKNRLLSPLCIQYVSHEHIKCDFIVSVFQP